MTASTITLETHQPTLDITSYLRDVPTAIVVGSSSSRTVEIAALVQELSDQLRDVQVVAVSAALPRSESLPYDSKVEQVIAIGGGKVLDCGKMLSLRLSPADLSCRLAAGETSLSRQARLICIPTTAGSGSEATHFCVCYLGNRKISISHPSLQPDVALLYPNLLRSLPIRDLRISAIDAMAQAIESFFSSGATIQSSDFASKALVSGIPLLRELSDKQPQLTTLAGLQRCANWSGQAINIAKTNLPHALSYYLTANYGVPHGLAVGIFIEPYLQFIDSRRGTLDPNRKDAFKLICKTIGVNSNAWSSGAWLTLLTSLSLPSKLSDLSTPIEREALLGSVNVERLNNLAVAVDLNNFLDDAFK